MVAEYFQSESRRLTDSVELSTRAGLDTYCIAVALVFKYYPETF